MKTRVNTGEIFSFLATSAISAGDVIEFGSDADGFIGIAVDDIADTERGAVAVNGVFELEKVTGASTGGSAGDTAYVTPAGLLTVVLTSNHRAGVFAEDAADGDALARVMILPTTTAPVP